MNKAKLQFTSNSTQSIKIYGISDHCYKVSQTFLTYFTMNRRHHWNKISKLHRITERHYVLIFFTRLDGLDNQHHYYFQLITTNKNAFFINYSPSICSPFGYGDVDGIRAVPTDHKRIRRIETWLFCKVTRIWIYRAIDDSKRNSQFFL